jgi:NTP pyrophosphatase (non-canonical NTP hydrolase)
MDAYESQLNTMQNYQELAQRTAADPSPELIERLLDPKTLYFLDRLLFEISSTAFLLDALKKHIFYGKPKGHSEVHDRELSDKQKQLLVNENGRRIKIIHGIIGVVTEAGELADTVRGFIGQEEDFDFINLKEEGGDVMWYLAELFQGSGTTFTEAQRVNIAKLVARYGDKFSEFAALNRDLDKERGVLESEYKEAPEMVNDNEKDSTQA